MNKVKKPPQTSDPALKPSSPAPQAQLKLRKGKRTAQAEKAQDHQPLNQDLQAHQIELQAQNEELDQIRAELEAGHRRYNDLFDFAPVGYISLMEDGTILEINLTGAKLLNIECVKLINRPFGLFVSPQSRATLDNLLKNVFNSQKKQDCVVELLKDGQAARWIHLEALCFDAPLGRECRVVFRDVTELKHAENALLESEAEYRTLFENSIMAISQTLPDGRLIHANKAYAQLYGYGNPEEMMAEVTHVGRFYANPEDREEVLHVLAAKGIMEPREMVVVRRDGTRLNVLVGVREIRDSEGNLRYLQAVHVDITDRKRSEDALRESEERYRQLFDVGPDGFAVIGPDGCIRRANIAQARMYGYDSPGELIGVHATRLVAMSSRDYSAQILRRRLNGEDISAVGYELLRKDGTTFYGETLAAILRKSDGSVSGYICVTRDITEHKQAEQALRDSQEQLRSLGTYWQKSIEAERALISREIHDEFGQSMTALKMDLAWLAKHLPAGEEWVKRIQGMNTLVDDSIILMRRIATDLRPNLLDDLGLTAALEWQAHEFSNRSGIPCRLNLYRHDLELDLTLSTNIFRIFQETLTNVTRHSHATHVDVKLEMEDQTLIMTIRDNGRGITEREIKDHHSLGVLGLRERAAMSGGSLDIHGVPGKGTTVTVRIPLPISPSDGGKS